MDILIGYWWVIPIVLALIGWKLVLRLLGIVIIPDDALGIVNKKFVLFGTNKTLPDGCIIALNGEAGIQADTLAPGIHFWYWPWQYEITQQQFITIKRGQVGVVQARDGKTPANGRVLARTVACDSFQDARMFLTNGGERGTQMDIIKPGAWRINTGLFEISVASATEIQENKVGVVTTLEGLPLPTGEIAGHHVAGHNSFQDGETFVANGGFKGLQEQILLAGMYYINPLFVTVEEVDMTVVPIANVGVVISFVGEEAEDVTGDAFKHGNMVAKGKKGVWVEPLDPGKYPVNPYTHKVELVPTANIVLNWATGKTESHKLDAELSTIKVRSADGFEFNLDVSQIIHIPRNDAPKVIARFGKVANLVTQVLEPTIGNYFRNAAQDSDVIAFLKERTKRQQEAKSSIAEVLGGYNVLAVDTLIGDINPPKDLMKTLTDRKLAEQETVTFETQRGAQEVRQKLQQSTAMADTQAQVVASERQVTIQEFNARAAVNQAKGAAEAKTINAKADAEVITLNGNAEAGRTLAIGKADAEVIQLKTDAVGQGNFALIETAKALSKAGQALVPSILVAGGNDGQGGTSGGLVDVLLGTLLRDSLRMPELPKAPKEEPAEGKAEEAPAMVPVEIPKPQPVVPELVDLVGTPTDERRAASYPDSHTVRPEDVRNRRRR